MNQPTGKRSFSDLASRSLILSALVTLSRFLREKFAESFIGHLLVGNHRNTGSGLFSYLGEKIGIRRRISIPFKRFMAKSFEKSTLLNQAKTGIAQLPNLQLRCIGILYFATGLYLSISFLIQRFALTIISTPASVLFYGIIAAVVGSLLSTSQKRCGEAICQSKVLSFFLFRTLGIRKEALCSQGRSIGRGDAAFLFGIAAGAFATLTSPLLVLLAIPVLGIAYAILSLPECGVVLLLLTLPFLGTAPIGILTVYVTICWLLKWIRGKRVLATASLDVSVLCFAIVLLFGGLVSVTRDESLRAALIQIAMMAGYFITVNLIRTSEWVDRCVKALLFSVSITAFVGVMEYLLGFAPQNWLDVSMLSIIPGRSVSFFGNPNVLAELLVMTLPFFWVSSRLAPAGDRRLGYRILFLLSAACLLFTWSRGGWLSALLALLLLVILTSPAILAKIFCMLLLLPGIVLLLPNSITTRFLSTFGSSDSSIAYRIGIWQGVDHIVADCFAGGIGVGETAFRRVYPLYSLSALEAAPHTHNLYLQILVAVGVTGLILFMALLLIFLRHYASYTTTGQNDDLPLRLTAAAGFSGILGLLFMGMTDYVWYNARILLLFWLIIGLTSAAIRTGARERQITPLDGPHLDLDCKYSSALHGRKDA